MERFLPFRGGRGVDVWPRRETRGGREMESSSSVCILPAKGKLEEENFFLFARGGRERRFAF
jgi:hypothetical protein